MGLEYGLWFVVLAVVCSVVVWRQFKKEAVVEADESDGADSAFPGFQRGFLIVYCLAMLGDWLQGPYVYALYASYGYSMSDIGTLFLMGFGSSMVFGTIVGSFADRVGRAKACMGYCVFYIASCVTKHSSNYSVLMLGRVLGGIATSILYSAFESWMVSRHNSMRFPSRKIGNTFSKMIFGSGLMAIVAGLIASFLARQFGPVAPFDAAIVVLLIAAAFIHSWPENYGDCNSGHFDDERSIISRAQRGMEGLKEGLHVLMTNQKILLLGAIQSCFEGAMFTFVFMWTPAMEQNDAANGGSELPHGLIFAVFMVALMIGSKLYVDVSAAYAPESYGRGLMGISAVALLVPAILPTSKLVFPAFLVFEACCGVYFATIGTLRSNYIPEEQRATIMNLFRVPLNFIVMVSLWNLKSMTNSMVFMLCSLFLAVACGAFARLHTLGSQHNHESVATSEESADAKEATVGQHEDS